MYVSQKLLKVGIFIADDGFVPILEEMPMAVMP
jgi:hypothetical protein